MVRFRKVLDNGPETNARQAIVWSDDVIIYLRMYTAPINRQIYFPNVYFNMDHEFYMGK